MTILKALYESNCRSAYLIEEHLIAKSTKQHGISLGDLWFESTEAGNIKILDFNDISVDVLLSKNWLPKNSYEIKEYLSQDERIQIAKKGSETLKTIMEGVK